MVRGEDEWDLGREGSQGGGLAQGHRDPSGSKGQAKSSGSHASRRGVCGEDAVTGPRRATAPRRERPAGGRVAIENVPALGRIPQQARKDSAASGNSNNVQTRVQFLPTPQDLAHALVRNGTPTLCCGVSVPISNDSFDERNDLRNIFSHPQVHRRGEDLTESKGEMTSHGRGVGQRHRRSALTPSRRADSSALHLQGCHVLFKILFIQTGERSGRHVHLQEDEASRSAGRAPPWPDSQRGPLVLAPKPILVTQLDAEADRPRFLVREKKNQQCHDFCYIIQNNTPKHTKKLPLF